MRKWKQTHNARERETPVWLWLSASWYRFSWARMSTPVHPVGSRAKNVNSYVRKWGERGSSRAAQLTRPAQRSREPKNPSECNEISFHVRGFCASLHVMVIIHSYPPTHRWVCKCVWVHVCVSVYLAICMSHILRVAWTPAKYGNVWSEQANKR